jgi:hypothetical protein
LLGVQALAVVCIVFWGVSSTFLLLWLVNKITPIRMDPKDELLGADFTEHNIMPSSPRAVEATVNSSSNGKSDDCQISQRSRISPQSDDKMAGIYKTYFTDESATDRSRAPARINLSYQHDEGA